MKFYLYAMKGTKTKWMYCSDFKQDNLAHKALDESEHWRIFHRKVARKAPEAGELSINPKIQENVRITVNNLTAMNTSLVPWWRQNWCQQSYLSLKLRDTKFRSTPFKKKEWPSAAITPPAAPRRPPHSHGFSCGAEHLSQRAECNPLDVNIQTQNCAMSSDEVSVHILNCEFHIYNHVSALEQRGAWLPSCGFGDIYIFLFFTWIIIDLQYISSQTLH